MLPYNMKQPNINDSTWINGYEMANNEARHGNADVNGRPAPPPCETAIDGADALGEMCTAWHSHMV